jgi:hypothetical protein
MKKARLMMVVLAMLAMVSQTQAFTPRAVVTSPEPVAKPTVTVTSAVPVVVRAPAVATSTIPVAVVSAVAVAPKADGFKAGLCVGYRTGLDTATPSMAIGGQVVYCATKHISLKALVMSMEDNMDLTTMRMILFGLMPMLETQVWKNIRLYVGAGVSYNIFEVDLGTPGFSAEIEPSVGVLATVGMSFPVSERMQFFMDCVVNSVDTTAVVDGPCNDRVLVRGGADGAVIGGGFNIVF